MTSAIDAQAPPLAFINTRQTLLCLFSGCVHCYPPAVLVSGWYSDLIFDSQCRVQAVAAATYGSLKAGDSALGFALG